MEELVVIHRTGDKSAATQKKRHFSPHLISNGL